MFTPCVIVTKKIFHKSSVIMGLCSFSKSPRVCVSQKYEHLRWNPPNIGKWNYVYQNIYFSNIHVLDIILYNLNKKCHTRTDTLGFIWYLLYGGNLHVKNAVQFIFFSSMYFVKNGVLKKNMKIKWMINTQTSLSFKLIFKCLRNKHFFLYVLKQNTLNIILKETFNFSVQ